MSSKELDAHVGQAITLSNRETITVKAVGFGKLPIFSSAVSSLISKLAATGLKLETIKDYKIVFDVAFEETVALMGLIIGKKREWFNNIDLVDGLEILDVIIAQNFNDRAKKKLASIIERLKSLSPTLSRPSSLPDIREKQSIDTASKKSASSPGASASSET